MALAFGPEKDHNNTYGQAFLRPGDLKTDTSNEKIQRGLFCDDLNLFIYKKKKAQLSRP